MRLALLTLILFVALPSTFFAQETADRVSDFRYGTEADDILLDLDVLGDSLYGIFGSLNGDNNTGLISKINPRTGAVHPLLDPNMTGLYGNRENVLDPNVFRVGEMDFVYASDRARGSAIYRLENDELTLLMELHSNDFSKFVAFEGQIYFLVGGAPTINQSQTTIIPNCQLWRTDGTPENTLKIADIPAEYSALAAKIIPGEESLLLSLNYNENRYWLYSPTTDELQVLRQDSSPLRLGLGNGQNPFHTSEIFYNGYYYLHGTKNPGLTGSTFVRVNESTLDIVEFAVPSSLINGEPGDQPFTSIDFLVLNDELLFLASSYDKFFLGFRGPQLFRLEETTTTTTLIQPVSGIPNGVQRSIINLDYVINGNDLFYLTSGGDATVFLLRYNKNAGFGFEITNFGPLEQEGPNQAVFLQLTDDFYYVSSPSDGRIIRLSREEFTRTTVSGVGFNLRGNVYNDRPLSFIADDVFFYNDSPTALQGVGAYRWSPSEETPQLLLQTGEDRISTRPYLSRATPDDQRLIMFTDSTFLYDPTTRETSPYYTGGPNFQGFFSILGEYDDRFLFLSSPSGNQEQRILLLQSGGQLFTPELDTDIPLPNDTDYYLTNLFPSTPSNAFLASLRTVIDRDSMTYGVKGYVEGDRVRLSRFPFIGEHKQLVINYSDDEYAVFRAEALDRQSATYYVTDRAGNFLTQFTSDDGVLSTIGVTSTGLFFKDRYEGRSSNEIVHIPFDNTDSKEILPADEGVTFPFLTSTHYVVNDRLVFQAESEEHGFEWHVAATENNTTPLLKDINPGVGNGPRNLNAFLAKDKLFFPANDGTNGNELWVTDGTPEGTQMVADINPGPVSSNPSEFYRVNDVLYFQANGPSGYELYRMWLNDMTPELIIDVNSDGNGFPYDFRATEDAFYFVAREENGGFYELYQIALDLVPTDASPTKIPARVYPNPVGDLTVTLEAPTGESLRSLEVFNTTGQLLLQQSITGEHTQFDLRHLPAGQYWVRARYQSGRFSLNPLSKTR
ncbi:ELWxxDGT repeat protein [Lewinella sp. W8]|uniref:ELWxxDGT repeat protein n=1 Tax=Lewinella sp. W8 TaxID=2528208 RepID=UPI0010673AC1|nr:ELWxxDGT repeat protein [Lewinella sp. W8]MTB51189.1 T9SS type A sorting domain-containing protein [Lewinella sp. W8]